MAEGWARHFGKVEASSAGLMLNPLNQTAVQVMAEAGIDISGHRPKHLDEFQASFDYVVTVCGSASEACPVLPGNVKRRHIPFDDPPHLTQEKSEDEKLQIYRRVRDEIRDFVKGMPDNL